MLTLQMIERLADLVAQDVAAMLEFRGLTKTGGSCYYSALAAGMRLKRQGYHIIPQAGSMSWPRVTREQDDGKSDTHFSFIWQDNPVLVALASAQRCLPEMHVWLGIVDAGRTYLLDLTTGDLSELCTLLTGLEWRTEKPPRFLFTDALLPLDVHYTPSEWATQYVVTMWCMDHELRQLIGRRIESEPKIDTDVQVHAESDDVRERLAASAPQV